MSAICILLPPNSENVPPASESFPNGRSPNLDSPFLRLPGELQEMIRDEVIDVPWDDLTATSLSTHRALWQATRRWALIYDERFWKKIAFSCGFGGVTREEGGQGGVESRNKVKLDSSAPGGWNDDVRRITQYATVAGQRDFPFTVLTHWVQEQNSANRYFEMSPPLTLHPISLNPLLSTLYLNWWKAPPSRSFNTASFQSFFVCPAESTGLQNASPESTSSLPTLVAGQGHIALFSFATAPPIKTFDIIFDLGDGNIGGNEEWVKRTPVHLERDDGIRLMDIVQGMFNWLQTPLTPTQREIAIQRSRARNPNIFSRLEESTDEATLDIWLSKMFGKRLSLIQGRYQSLTQVSASGRTPSAVVLLAPRDDHLESLSGAMMAVQK